MPTDFMEPTAATFSALEVASSVTDVRAALSALHTRENILSIRLDTLLDSYADLKRDLLRLDSLRAALGAQVNATHSVSNSLLAGAANTAGGLSGRLHALDLEKSRVKDTLRVVEQVAELKACVAGVVGSMGSPQDWEAAASYIARAGRIPDEILRSGFANAVVPTVEVPDSPSITLEVAKESLCGLFIREFEKATKEGDSVRVTRFFKLFPLIGRGDVGLQVYGQHVCQGVADTARAMLREGTEVAVGRCDGFVYANALTMLFERIAQIVDRHGGLVERHYGAGKMVQVIQKLQLEADVYGGVILDTWSDERGVDRKLMDIRSYPFSFLVRTFLPPPKIICAQRVNSPALGSGSNDTYNSEDEGVDGKEVDTLLGEIAAMLGQWSLYLQFIARKCKDPQAPEDKPSTVPDFLARSNLRQKVSDKLASPYNVISTFFFRRSVEKAFQLNELPNGLSLNVHSQINSTPPYIISAVDDIMYIVNAVIQRSISTSQREVMESVIPTIARLLRTEFIGMLQRKMDDESYPQSATQGSFPPENKVISFIVLINSLDIANEYLMRIISSLLGTSTDTPKGAASRNPSTLKDLFPFGNDLTFVRNALHSLSTSFTSGTTELRNKGIQVLFNQVVKPRLRPLLIGAFRNVDYTLSEEEMAKLAAQDDEDEEGLDEVSRRFEHRWDALVKPMERIMTPKTFATLLDITATYLSRVLEKRVWSYAGRVTAYGAVRLERDFGGIVRVVARVDYTLREVFRRIMQILMAVNMDEEEWEELRAEGGMVWMLSEEDKRRARNLLRD